MCTSESFIQTVVFLDLQDKKMLVVKEKEVSVLTKQLQALQEEGKNDSAALEAAEQHFKAVSAGLSTNEDGEEATLAGQMMACKNDISKADTEAKQVSLAFRISIFAEGWLHVYASVTGKRLFPGFSFYHEFPTIYFFLPYLCSGPNDA